MSASSDAFGDDFKCFLLLAGPQIQSFGDASMLQPESSSIRSEEVFSNEEVNWEGLEYVHLNRSFSYAFSQYDQAVNSSSDSICSEFHPTIHAFSSRSVLYRVYRVYTGQTIVHSNTSKTDLSRNIET